MLKGNAYLLLLCAATLYFFVRGAPLALRFSVDFVPVYSGARCLLHGCNPYDTSQLEQQYVQAGGLRRELPSWHDEVPVYPPSTFLVLSPLALFRFPTARLLWMLLSGGLFVVSAAVILFTCPQRHRWLAATLVSIIVATAGGPLALGQPAILAISLLIIGVCLLLRSRFLPLASFLLMLSLAVKPQIGGLIVLYFLAKRIHWRYAALAMAGAFALLLSAGLILKMHRRSTDWISDLRTNISASLQPGASSDPRPANQGAVGKINLQAITSVFFADARNFNAIAYAIFLVLLAVWALAVRGGRTLDMHSLALGALAPLSLTPVYHSFPDSRLLLLTVPAALIVFQRRRLLGAFICILTILSTKSIQTRLQPALLHHVAWQSALRSKMFFIVVLRQQNLELLILFCLYVGAIFSIRFSAVPAIQSQATYPQALSSPLR